MAKLYYTKDIAKAINEKIMRDSANLVQDKDLTEDSLLHYVRELRIFRKYAEELIEELVEADEADDAHLARIRAELAMRDEKAVPHDN